MMAATLPFGVSLNGRCGDVDASERLYSACRLGPDPRTLLRLLIRVFDKSLSKEVKYHETQHCVTLLLKLKHRT